MTHGSGQLDRAEYGEGSPAPAPVLPFRTRAEVNAEIATAGIRARDLDKLVRRQARLIAAEEAGAELDALEEARS